MRILAENNSMEENSDFDAEFRVRLPSALASKIAQLAKKERRSRNLQYVFMLESYFERDNTLKDRIKALEDIIAGELENGEKAKRVKIRKTAV